MLRETLAPRFAPFEKKCPLGRLRRAGRGDLRQARSRENDHEITFFCNNVGFGAQFAALGGKAVALAREHGLGKEFSIDDWYEDER